MNHIGMDDVGAYIRASKDVIEIFKMMASLLPKGQQHEDAEKLLGEAERALQATEAQLAKSFGYHLCQCTFPPQIMLSQGMHPTHDEEVFKCSNCQKQKPSEGHFRSMDRMKAAF